MLKPMMHERMSHPSAGAVSSNAASLDDSNSPMTNPMRADAGTERCSRTAQ